MYYYIIVDCDHQRPYLVDTITLGRHFLFTSHLPGAVDWRQIVLHKKDDVRHVVPRKMHIIHNAKVHQPLCVQYLPHKLYNIHVMIVI